MWYCCLAPSLSLAIASDTLSVLFAPGGLLGHHHLAVWVLLCVCSDQSAGRGGLYLCVCVCVRACCTYLHVACLLAVQTFCSLCGIRKLYTHTCVFPLPTLTLHTGELLTDTGRCGVLPASSCHHRTSCVIIPPDAHYGDNPTGKAICSSMTTCFSVACVLPSLAHPCVPHPRPLLPVHTSATGTGRPLVHIQCWVPLGSGGIAQQEAPLALPPLPCVCVLPLNVQWGVRVTVRVNV